MSYEDISRMIESIGLPYAYYQFPQGTRKKPPFICFLYPQDNDFIADNMNYVKVEQLTIELYQETFDDTVEAQVEAVLQGNGMVWTKDRVPIDTEKLYETIYTMEVLVNA